MASVLVNEGARVISNMLYAGSDPDHQSTLQLGLFTNSSGLSASSVIGDITEPAQGGYARVPISGATWTISPTGECTRGDVVFTPDASGYGVPIYGWFLSWSGGTAPRLLMYEIDPSAPISLPNDNFSYRTRWSDPDTLKFQASPTPNNEAEEMLAHIVLLGTHADRGTSMELMLYTNSSGLDATTVAGDLVAPTDAGYADAPLANASWVIAADGRATYAQQQFVPDGGNWNEGVYGFAVRTVGGTAQRIVIRNPDAGAPILNDYDVDLNKRPQ